MFFGTPRTATISYEVITDGTGSSLMQKMIFSAAFFGLAGATLAKPGKLLEIVGFFLSPIKISALIFIGVCARLHPIGELTTATAAYETRAFGTGFVNGYQTLDVISALCFGAIITHTLKERGQPSAGIFTHSTAAAFIAAAGLAVIYICYLSMGSHSPVQGAMNGMQVMSAYVETVLAFMVRCCWRRSLPRLSGHGYWSDDRNGALFQPDDRRVLWAAGDAIPDGVSSTCRAGTELSPKWRFPCCAPFILLRWSWLRWASFENG